MLQRFTNVSKQVHQIFQSPLNGYHKSFKASQMSQSFSNVSKLLKCFKVAQMLQSFSKFSKPLKIFKASPKFQTYQMFQSSQKYEIFQHHAPSRQSSPIHVSTTARPEIIKHDFKQSILVQQSCGGRSISCFLLHQESNML